MGHNQQKFQGDRSLGRWEESRVKKGISRWRDKHAQFYRVERLASFKWILSEWMIVTAYWRGGEEQMLKQDLGKGNRFKIMQNFRCCIRDMFYKELNFYLLSISSNSIRKFSCKEIYFVCIQYFRIQRFIPDFSCITAMNTKNIKSEPVWFRWV